MYNLKVLFYIVLSVLPMFFRSLYLYYDAVLLLCVCVCGQSHQVTKLVYSIAVCLCWEGGGGGGGSDNCWKKMLPSHCVFCLSVCIHAFVCVYMYVSVCLHKHAIYLCNCAVE